MRQVLKLHPDSRCAAATRIEVDVARPRPGGLTLCYRVTGKMGDLRMPPVTAPTRSDNPWRHTCFEAFVRALPNAGYYELNFAPSTQWAAYAFSDYRSGMGVASAIGAPGFAVESSEECYRLRVSSSLDRLPGDAPWRLGLSAVIEETSGRKSYWALAHPPGKPDFHHSDCFALELPAT